MFEEEKHPKLQKNILEFAVDKVLNRGFDPEQGLTGIAKETDLVSTQISKQTEACAIQPSVQGKRLDLQIGI